MVQRPGVALDSVIRALLALGLWRDGVPSGLVLERAQLAIKYRSFIEKEEREAARQHRSSSEKLAPDLDYATIPGLRVEAVQKLNVAKPLTIGQAIRTSGVTPSDVGALLVHLARSRGGTTVAAGTSA
jgi:tRNA uridine 5-carboxymethylaminomethyl modification enzyme